MAGVNIHKTLTAAEVGLDTVLLNASNDSSTITCSGMNQATFVFNHSVHASTHDCTFYIEVSIDDGTTWSRLQTEQISTGVATLSNASYTKNLAATGVFTVDVPVNYSHIRIKALTGGAAGDKMSVTCRLGAI
jgi:hypothetical protein